VGGVGVGDSELSGHVKHLPHAHTCVLSGGGGAMDHRNYQAGGSSVAINDLFSLLFSLDLNFEANWPLP